MQPELVDDGQLFDQRNLRIICQVSIGPK
jgi:hypothetical protein